MNEHTIELPMTKEVVESLKLGDVVYVSGIFYSTRDQGHMKALQMMDAGEKLPVDFKGSAVYHCGPIAKKDGEKWIAVAAGPTTSARMNTLTPKFIEKTGVRAVIGKGGMNKDVLDALKKFGCCYLAYTGGTAVLAAERLEIKKVDWFELGMPEALWTFNGKKFGPLIVAMDCHGGSLYANLDKEIAKNVEGIRKKLGIA
jgi:fumarate hydratase subunit beta